MSRLRYAPFWLTPLLIGAAAAQQTPPPKQALPPDEDPAPAQTKSQSAKPSSDSELPPDEDVSTVKEEFSFNPVKAKKAISAGDFYFKKGNYKASSDRYREATKWNDSNADAWLKLGESEEKREQPKNAREAYQRYLQLAGNSKSANDVKKKLDRLK